MKRVKDQQNGRQGARVFRSILLLLEQCRRERVNSQLDKYTRVVLRNP